MPERIVDDLELVEIDVQQRVRDILARALFVQRPDETVLELASVDQSGHGVVRGLVTELPEKA